MQLSAADGGLWMIYKVADAVSKSVKTELLKLRFPRDDLIGALKNALVQFDLIIERETPSSHIHNQPSAEFFHCYVLMMTQLTELIPKDNSSWPSIYASREQKIKAWQDFINPADYSKYYQQLSQHYDSIGNDIKVKECQRNVFVHVSVHHDMCTRAKEAQCTYDNIGIAYFNIGNYYMAAEILEKAVEMETTNMLNRAKLLGHLVDAHKNQKQYEKVFQTAGKLRVLHPNITTASFSELLWEYDTMVKCLEVYEEFGFAKEASVLYEKYIMLFKQYILQKDGVEFSCTSENLDISLLYKALKQMYDIEEYAAVTEIGSLILDAMNRKPKEVVPFILLFKLLVGKAKFHGMNFSAGLKDIEFVLNFIINTKSEELRKDFERNKEEACWYLIPQLVYINICYNVMAIIYGGFFT